eukprot:1159488-Pelagomonas_calceolata.AAC.1
MANSEDVIHFLQKQTNETYRFISDLLDIFCAVGTVEQTEQPNYLAEAVHSQSFDMFTFYNHNNNKLPPSLLQLLFTPSHVLNCLLPYIDSFAGTDFSAAMHMCSTSMGLCALTLGLLANTRYGVAFWP